MSNIIELANLIFQDEPKEPYCIQIEIENYNSVEDLFEVILHLFIYGMKMKNISIHNINDVKPFFRAIGIDFNLKIIEYSEYEFLTNPLYLERYCNIAPSTFSDQNLDNLQFISSKNYKSGIKKIDDITACYVHYEQDNLNQSFIAFINFKFLQM